MLGGAFLYHRLSQYQCHTGPAASIDNVVYLIVYSCGMVDGRASVYDNGIARRLLKPPQAEQF